MSVNETDYWVLSSRPYSSWDFPPEVISKSAPIRGFMPHGHIFLNGRPVSGIGAHHGRKFRNRHQFRCNLAIKTGGAKSEIGTGAGDLAFMPIGMQPIPQSSSRREPTGLPVIGAAHEWNARSAAQTKRCIIGDAAPQ